MSLIGEALKKAHLDAIRQDGPSPRLAHTPGVAHYRPSPTSHKREWTLALVVSNLLLALAITAFFLWPRAGASSEATVAPPVDSASGPVRSALPLTDETEPAMTETAPLKPPATPAEQPASQVRAPESEPSTAVIEPPATTRKATVAESSSRTSSPAGTRAVDGLVAGQVYLRSVPVPDGTELILNGMSVAGGRGVALINGRMVREGDRVGPFTVGSMGDRKVALEYKGITIYLKMP